MERYLPAIVTGLIALFGYVFMYGSLTQSTKNNSEAIEDLKKSRSAMWGEINEHGERLAKVETACRINHPERASIKSRA